MQLWWEKLQQSGIVGSSRGAGGMGGSGGYHHVQVKHDDHGIQFPSGAPPARMAPSRSGSDAYGKVNVKNELPQTDGADVEDNEAGVEASRRSRRPRRGDYVEVQVEMGGGSSGAAGGARILNVEQLDGAGAGPRKRGRDEGEKLHIPFFVIE